MSYNVINDGREWSEEKGRSVEVYNFSFAIHEICSDESYEGKVGIFFIKTKEIFLLRTSFTGQHSKRISLSSLPHSLLLALKIEL